MLPLHQVPHLHSVHQDSFYHQAALSEIALWQWRHATNQSDGMKPQGEQEELDDAPQTKCLGTYDANGTYTQ